MERMLTTGLIAKELNEPLWRVQYLLQSRGIKAEQRVGHLRVFTPDVLPQLENEIAAIANRSRPAR